MVLPLLFSRGGYCAYAFLRIWKGDACVLWNNILARVTAFLYMERDSCFLSVRNDTLIGQIVYEISLCYFQMTQNATFQFQ